MMVVPILLCCLLTLLQGIQARRLPFIIGGSDAGLGDWPWQASLQRRATLGHTCGSSLISQKYLVTAAHCVGAGASGLYIVLGMHDQEGIYGDKQLYDIAKITSHPGWANDPTRGFPNDIAIIELARNADLDSAYISTINLPSAGQDLSGAECYITGWGLTNGDGTGGLPNVLQVTRTNVYGSSACLEYIPIVDDFHTCVFDYDWESTGACQGDSGGPLSCRVGGQWVLGGAASFVVVGCQTSFPSVYANVPYFRTWIRSITGV